MNQTSKSLHDFIRISVILSFIIVLVFTIFGSIKYFDDTIFKGSGGIYDGTWYFENPNGSVEEFTIPTTLNVPEGESVRFYTILPDDLKNGMYMAILSGRDFEAYIDDQLIFSYSHRNAYNSPLVKSILVPIALPDDSAGKKLTIVRNEPGVSNANVNTAYLGDLYAICSAVMEGKGFIFAAGIFLSFIAILIIIIFGALAAAYKRQIPLVYLAMGILACSTWMIMDSRICQFIFKSFYYDGVTAYMLILLIPCPFCHYLNHVQQRRYQKIYDTAEAFLIISFFICAALHFFTGITYEKMLVPMDAILVLSMILILALVIHDTTKYKSCDYMPVATGLGVLVVLSIIEIIFINVSPHNTYKLEGIFELLGLFILLGCAVLDQVNRLRQIEQETREALAASKAKTTFLANMSHEIRTPINAIMGLNEMIIRETDDQAVREHAIDVSNASKNLLELINDILDFSKIEAGKTDILEDNYNLGSLVYSINSLIIFKAQSKGLTLNTKVDPSLPSILFGDEKHLREIMVNILNNAVKYTQEGHIDFLVDGYFDEAGKFVLKIQITDTGIGIKPEDQAKLFKEFERFDLKRNRNIEGTGLGLAITAKLVDLMGGRISVDSEYGAGSTFTVEIPQTVISNIPVGDYTNHQEGPAPISDSQIANFKAPEARILVVDDNKMNLTVTKGLLKDTEIQLTTATSGEQMLALISRKPFDIIFLDHMMPGMDGVEALHKAKELTNNMCKDTPVIVLTANAIVGAKESYIKEGFTDYLSKPVQTEELISMIIKYLP